MNPGEAAQAGQRPHHAALLDHGGLRHALAQLVAGFADTLFAGQDEARDQDGSTRVHVAGAEIEQRRAALAARAVELIVVARLADGGATLAARLPGGDVEEVRKEVGRMARSLAVTRKPGARK